MDVYQLIGRNYHDLNLCTIQEYLKRGGDPNYQLYNGVTVFYEAICYPSDNIDVINELLNAGADVNHVTHLGKTPLLLAARYRKRRVVQALIQSGASVNAKDFLGRTVLHHAICKWVLDVPGIFIQFTIPDKWIVNELLKHQKIDCNQVDFYGETPLKLAVLSQHIEITRLLLRNNADPNIGNNFGETPLHVAFSQPGNYVQMQLLLGGASIYSVDKRGKTPLDVLIENGLKGLDIQENERVNDILKTIAYKFSITSDLKQKLEIIPYLSQIFNQYCKEADQMRGDFICGKITMHDFIWDCFAESDSDTHIHQIHKPVVERLVRNVYPGYFIDFIGKIPKSSLCQILQRIAERKHRVNDLASLLSILDIIELISMYLSHDQVFDLIRAFSDVTISE